MNTSTFRQDLNRFFDRYPTARCVFYFMHSFAFCTIGDCALSIHMDWSFRTHIGELAARSTFFALVFSTVFPWMQKRGIVSATKPGT